VDVNVTCELHILYGHGKETRVNQLTLQTSTSSYPVVKRNWEGTITVYMDPETLTNFGKARLAERLNELNPPKKIDDISSLLGVFALFPRERAWIDVAVLSSDGISGTRNAKHKELDPRPLLPTLAVTNTASGTGDVHHALSH